MNTTSKHRLSRRLTVIALTILLSIGAAAASVYLLSKDRGIVAQDSTGAFTFTYPKDWILSPYEWQPCCHGEIEEPDWTRETQPITLYPAENKEATVSITNLSYDDTTYPSFDAIRSTVHEDYFAKILFDGSNTSGRSALFSRVDYLGPPDAKVESFTDHRYYYDNGNAYLRIDFREKYHHDWPDDEAGPDIDHSKYVQDFEYIAKSIKFLR